ncbi:MAG: phenylalanine--tRNA ligase subunit beta [Chitinophagales bacterium]|nr:phenylalanine--tRNA ligase subunit beta [Chitinophagales bacterium]
MNISYNLLKKYLDNNLTPQEIAEILTNIGLEVENIQHLESVKGGLQGLKIGLVKSVGRHPDADKLTVTRVDTGDGNNLQIICGAPNVAPGQKVVVALHGTTIFPFEDKPVKIKKAKIRGILSEGMICAEDEIGLSADHSGILILPDTAEVGSPAAKYFNIADDYILSVGITPNRSDAMSHIGVARDLAAYLSFNRDQKISLTIPDISAFQIHNHTLPIEVTVENSDACPRFSGVTISGITVAPSPEWLKNTLNAVGIRSINNIVDITNFVIIECGQPLHAYDAKEIKGKEIYVKTLEEGTLFKTLDDKDLKLRASDLMVCNSDEGMCIAGVYGGAKSGVKETTESIFLEAAYWNPSWIRRTAAYHHLRTDAASHFERGTDPNGNIYALKRAALLICEYCGGQISSELTDVYPEIIKESVVSLKWSKLNRYTGINIQESDAKKILEALDFRIVSEDEEGITVRVPTFKTDVLRDVDLIEEIQRIYGIEKIPVPEKVRSALSYSADKKDKSSFVFGLSNALTGFGFREMINNSISNSKHSEVFYPESQDSIVRLQSFSNIGLDSMRTSMVFPALEAVHYNHNHKQYDLKLFEFGKTYSKNNNKYLEKEHLILLVTGSRFQESWNQEEQPVDFFFLKGIVENILKKAGISGFQTASTENEIYQSMISYDVNKQLIASIGKLNTGLLSYFDIKKEVFYAEFDLEALLNLGSNSATFVPPPKFPSVRRDLALIIDKKTSFQDIEGIAFKSSNSLLKEVNLFDVYSDEKIGSDKKSYAVSFMFQHPDKTLTDQEVENEMNQLLKTFSSELNAVVRH